MAAVFTLFVFTIYPVTMICIGALHRLECTIEPYIPIWLIVDGTVVMFLAFLVLISLILGVTL